jgi:outer membrane receptor protein involved in Fe transport
MQSGLDTSIIAFLQTRLEFATETLYNYELGYKAAFPAAGLRLRLAAFYMDREDMQLKAWYNEGPQFVGYTDNAASGNNRGLEVEADWQPLARLQVNVSLGLLDTRIEGFVANDPDLGIIDKSGREQAQAPNWQYSASAEYAFAGHAWARLEIEGKDAYYLSDSDDQRSSSWQLLHVSAGYRLGSLETALWVRNLLDEDYVVHGFYFGNDPRKFYANEAYYQFGAPRVAGFTLVWHL